jgi:asparagine synthase (glutamine-hydrolysing)
MDKDKVVDQLARSLDASVRNIAGPLDDVAISFSGGLDSSLLAFLASKHSRPVLYVVGEEKSSDMESARSAASSLELPLTEIILSEKIVKGALSDVTCLARSTNPVLISYKLPQFLVSRFTEEDVILIGNGADELFGGYSRYERMEPKELPGAMQWDLDEMLRIEMPIDRRIGNEFGKTFEYPYLSAEVVEIAMGLPIGSKVGKNGRKAVLRDVARYLGLSSEISAREKKAAQYGTGTNRLMKKIAKTDGLSISRYLEELADF